MKRLPLRHWILLGLLGLLPAALYWDTIFHRLGFHDDYAVLREVQARLQGRPAADARVHAVTIFITWRAGLRPGRRDR